MGSLATADTDTQDSKSSGHSRIDKSTRRRMQILKNGFEPLPAIGKGVHLPGWNRKTIDQVEIESWNNAGSWANTSIRCHNVIAIDIDVEDQWLANSIVAQTRIELDSSPFERIGREPRVLLVYGVSGDDIRKRKIQFSYKNENHKIEILAHGQQFVAFGIHPDTRKQYKWIGPHNPLNTSLDDLPIVSRQDVDNYIHSIEHFLKELGCQVIQEPFVESGQTKPNGGTIHSALLKAALDHIPADDYDEWIQVGMAIHYETNGSTDGLAIWDKWSSTSGLYDQARENECEYKWQGFGGKSSPVTGATILLLAKKYGFDLAGYSGPREDLSADIESLPTISLENGHDHRAIPFQGQDGSFPQELFEPLGLVGLMAKYTNQASIRNQPILAICAGLMTVAALTRNWFVVGRWRTALNIYLVAVAETGEGKEAPRSAIKAALNVVDGMSRVKESVASSPALLRALSSSDRSDITILFDEIGRLLSAAVNPNNGHLFELISELMRLFGQANSTNGGKIYANENNNIPSINRPYVNMFGTTTKRSLADALSSKDVVDGTLNRMLVAVIENRRPTYNDPDFTIGPKLEKALKNLQSLDPFELPDEDGEDWGDPIIMGVSPDAERAFIDYRDEADECRISDDKFGPLYARAFENAIKVAGLISVGLAAERGPIHLNKPFVDKQSAEWGIKFVRWCVGSIVKIGSEEIADNNIERAITQIRNYIINMFVNWESTSAPRDADKRDMNLKGYIAKSQITKRFQKMPARLRDEAILTLVESEDIQQLPPSNDSTIWYSPTDNE